MIVVAVGEDDEVETVAVRVQMLVDKGFDVLFACLGHGIRLRRTASSVCHDEDAGLSSVW